MEHPEKRYLQLITYMARIYNCDKKTTEMKRNVVENRQHTEEQIIPEGESVSSPDTRQC